jgi:predicted TIM-barrel fold metal-dependent hydrolase
VIIDCHCHLGPGVGLALPGPDPFARYLTRARAAGIAQSVAFSGFHPDYAAANVVVARAVAASRGRLVGFACIHAARDAGRVAWMAYQAARMGLRGLKVHRRDARITREICVAARRLRWPVLYDPMGEAAVVDDISGSFPDVRFIVPHLGSFDDDVRAQLAVIEVVARRANVWVDTSAVKVFDVLVRALDRLGPGKLIFGSDGPWLHPWLELAKVRALGLAPGDERDVLGGNASRLLAPAVGPVSSPLLSASHAPALGASPAHAW